MDNWTYVIIAMLAIELIILIVIMIKLGSYKSSIATTSRHGPRIIKKPNVPKGRVVKRTSQDLYHHEKNKQKEKGWF